MRAGGQRRGDGVLLVHRWLYGRRCLPGCSGPGRLGHANPVHAWTATIPLDQVEATFPSIGAVEQVEVTQRNGLGQIGGRVDELKVVGDAVARST